MVRYQDKGSLVEASFHRMIELLAKDAGAVKSSGTSVRDLRRVQADGRGVVGD